MSIIRIATRPSKLAVIQANTVAAAISKAHPEVRCELIPIKTSADIHINKPIHSIGGKGIFIKELEQALLKKQADIAVHSVKDMPSMLAEPFSMPAILQRLCAHDILISNNHITFDKLAPGSIIGTSSLRRTCQLQLLRPELVYRPIRGNVDTRIKKLEDQYDAIVLAAAGVMRLGYEQYITTNFSLDDILPAAGQAAIGIECLKDDQEIIDLIKPLNHTSSAAAVTAERHAMLHLGGHCMAPIAAYASDNQNNITLKVLVTNKDSSIVLRACETADMESAAELGKDVAEQLLSQGALELIQTAI